MSTTWRGRHSVLRIFKGRRERTGHHATCGALPAAGPYLRLSRFQGGQAVKKKRELFPGPPPTSPDSLTLPSTATSRFRNINLIPFRSSRDARSLTVFATTTKICTDGRSARARAPGFAATAAPSYSSRPGTCPDGEYRYEPPPEFPLASPYSGIVHHLSGPDRHAHTRTLLRRSRSVGGATQKDPTNQLPYALRVYSPVDSHTCQTPWSVFQDGPNGEPTGRCRERADAEARQRRTLPATIEAKASPLGLNDILGFGLRPNPHRSTPRVDWRTGLGRNLPPDWGCIPKQPDSPTAPRDATGSGHDGALTLSGAPFQGTWARSVAEDASTDYNSNDRAVRFSSWADPARAGDCCVARARRGTSGTGRGRAAEPSPERPFGFVTRVLGSFCWAGFDNDPSAGSPTETLLRLLLPLNDKVQWTSRDVAGGEPPTSPRSEHFTGPFNR
ncbi:hypothetical protein RHSIM_RhsimUnG0072700 [Rhododendron simsii]|uniref:Senescence-associated protein n=1 Tax=Rhododendron simsii TaxID=118357 RepID=A0A834FYC9_RHOSS|nr:hypothetical protein RHSIM_RhsimUnG0072700 [Rhododendron simsii]